jgi:hypothetical protein
VKVGSLAREGKPLSAVVQTRDQRTMPGVRINRFIIRLCSRQASPAGKRQRPINCCANLGDERTARSRAVGAAEGAGARWGSLGFAWAGHVLRVERPAIPTPPCTPTAWPHVLSPASCNPPSANRLYSPPQITPRPRHLAGSTLRPALFLSSCAGRTSPSPPAAALVFPRSACKVPRRPRLAAGTAFLVLRQR